MQNIDGSRAKVIASLRFSQLELSKGSINEQIAGFHFMWTCDVVADILSDIVTVLDVESHCSCNIVPLA